MSESNTNLLKIVGTILVAFFAWKLIIAPILGIVSASIPIAVVAGVIYLVYRASGGKAIGGGGRRTLP